MLGNTFNNDTLGLWVPEIAYPPARKLTAGTWKYTQEEKEKHLQTTNFGVPAVSFSGMYYDIMPQLVKQTSGKNTQQKTKVYPPWN